MGDFLTPASANEKGYFDTTGICIDTVEGDVLIGDAMDEEQEPVAERQPICVVTVGIMDATGQQFLQSPFLLVKDNVRALHRALGSWLEDGGHLHLGAGDVERRVG